MMPVVSRTQPGRPARLVYVRSFTDDNIWRVETSAAGAPASSPPAVAISSPRLTSSPVFSGRAPGCLRFQSFGSLGNLGVGSRRTNAVQLTSLGAPVPASPAGLPTAN